MKRIFCIIFLLPCILSLDAQVLMSLNDAIEIAKNNSYSAKIANFSFMNSYWSYRSYKANWLPSLNLSGTLMNYNRSIVEARNSETGRVSYVDNNSLYNYLNLSVNQNLPWADGSVSIKSNLSVLNQFEYDSETYNSSPFVLYYNQPLRRYSNLNWQRKIEPLEYEQAQRSYLETMQSITINVISYYFSALLAQSEYEQSKTKYKDLSDLYAKTQKKLELGLVMKSELQQLELSLLNAQMSINTNELSLENSLFNLFSYLHISDYKNIQLVAPSLLPDLDIALDDVLQKAYENSSHSVSQQLTLLNAEKSLAATKANNGLQVSLNAQVGLTQTAYSLDGAYKNLKDNEVVYLSFSLPIYDWGLGRGNIKKAKAQLEIARMQAQQDNMDFVQNIRTKVMQFNSRAEQCKISKRALEIAEDTYLAAYKRYENGSMTITDLNSTNNALESAQSQYLSQLHSFWSNYYYIQKLTLYDYIKGEKITCDYESIIK